MQYLFFLLKRIKSQVLEETEPNCSRISHKKMAAFRAPQLLCKLGSRRGKNSIFLSSCKRLPKRETQTEAGFGRDYGPWLQQQEPWGPKTPQVQVPLQFQELNPPLPGDLGSMDLLWSFGCLIVTGQSDRGRRPAGTFWGLQSPSSNPGLGTLMNSKRKKKYENHID